MSKISLLYHPSVETSGSTREARTRPSLYDNKDEFIERIAPVASAVIFFGNFSLAPQDASLSHQALFKLSFLNRHFLQHGGLRIMVNRHTAILFGTLTSRHLLTMAEILTHQIAGIRQVKNETELTPAATGAGEQAAVLESIQFLFATDQTLRTGVRATLLDDQIKLEGEVENSAQKVWAEQLAEAAGGKVDSHVATSTFTPAPALKLSEPPQLDDESLQALILFRLGLINETKTLSVKIKATRGVVTLQGKVSTEALRQRVENIARSTLGVRELRSSISLE